MDEQTPKKQRREDSQSSSSVSVDQQQHPHYTEQQAQLSAEVQMELESQGNVWAIILARDSLQAEQAAVLIGNHPFRSDIQVVRQLADAAVSFIQNMYAGQFFEEYVKVVVSKADPPPARLRINQEISLNTDLQPEQVGLFDVIDAAHRGDKNATNPYFVILTRARPQTLEVDSQRVHYGN